MEYVVSARIAQLQVIDPGEIRHVQLVLPDHIEIEGKQYPLHDEMRPGTAFLAKPWGQRTEKLRRRMYTRSNSSCNAPGVLETFINDTHRPQTDTSAWWQSEVADRWQTTGELLDVRVKVDAVRSDATVYENTVVCKETNLRLEPDGEWEGRQFVCVAFGTGVTPFLSYIHYMEHQAWQEGSVKHPGHLTLIASVRHEQQLMWHQELLKMAQRYPQFFRYVPVLTRSWPTQWTFPKGRIVRTTSMPSGEEQIDMAPLLELVPDFSHVDLRLCGSVAACRQLRNGLQDRDISPASVRAESW